jgi:hypothetical protein
MTVPTYLLYYVLIGTAGVIVAVLFGVNRALAEAHWPAEHRTRTVSLTAIVLTLWLAGAIGLGAAGTFQQSAGGVPTIQYAIFLPILIGALLIWRSEAAKRVIDAVPQAWLVGIQLYRALGVIFLILYASGWLPGLFAWPAGVGDILVGVLALVVATAYARDPNQNGDMIFAWNWFGILDLVIAVGAGFITSPSLVQPFVVEPANLLISAFPLVLIPTFLVPLSIILHIASLAKLRRSARPKVKKQSEIAVAA